MEGFLRQRKFATENYNNVKCIMKKKIFLLSIMLIVALTAASDEYIDPLTNVVYTYEPGQPTASVKA